MKTSLRLVRLLFSFVDKNTNSPLQAGSDSETFSKGVQKMRSLIVHRMDTVWGPETVVNRYKSPEYFLRDAQKSINGAFAKNSDLGITDLTFSFCDAQKG